MEQWKIHRDRTSQAKACCRRAALDEYYAVLELPSCVRRDLCAACFQRLEREADEPPIYWVARRRASAKKGPVLDLASLKVLFDRLGESADGADGAVAGDAVAGGAEADGADAGGERAQGLRYFVALLLLRKRMLKIVDSDAPEARGADLVVVDPKREGDEARPVALFAPPLDDERLAHLKDELLAAIASEESGETGSQT